MNTTIKEILADTLDMTDAPPSEFIEYLYNCSECSSNIEIISLDENKIKFKCSKNHNIEIEIKEYLKKMKKYNNIKLNNDICDKHKNRYLSFCFDCNMHLCKECLKTRYHIMHNKIYLIELMIPNKMFEKIKEFKKRNSSILNEYIEKNKNIDKAKNENIDKEISELKTKNKEYIFEKEYLDKEYKIKKEELEKNKNNLEYNKLKNEYENKIKELKMNFISNINDIRNKYKNKNSTNNILSKNISSKIDKYSNYNIMIEIIFNAYSQYKNNYYNSININNLFNKNNNICISKIIKKYKDIEEKNKKLEENKK